MEHLAQEFGPARLLEHNRVHAFESPHAQTQRRPNMHNAAESHRFRVHARHIDAHHARIVVESSFEAAAIAYAEDFPHAGTEADLKIIVHDLDNGREHCFTVDLETGEAGACG
jgi:hypothetical protein